MDLFQVELTAQGEMDVSELPSDKQISRSILRGRIFENRLVALTEGFKLFFDGKELYGKEGPGFIAFSNLAVKYFTFTTFCSADKFRMSSKS